LSKRCILTWPCQGSCQTASSN